jgi:hypothetical protein
MIEVEMICEMGSVRAALTRFLKAKLRVSANCTTELSRKTHGISAQQPKLSW